MVQCSFNITDGAKATGKYYQDAASKGAESDEVKKKGRKRRQRRRKKNKAKEDETEEDIFCDEGYQQPQQFLSDCDDQVVDDLNQCMEMEMDQTEIADFLKGQQPTQDYDDEEFEDQFDDSEEEEDYDEEEMEASEDEEEDEEDLEYEEEEVDEEDDEGFFQDQKNKKTIQFREEV